MATIDKINCERCSKNINLRSGKPLSCDGDCKKSFHLACAGVSSKRYDEIVKNSSVFWFCEKCTIQRNKRRSVILNNNTAVHVNTSPKTTNYIASSSKSTQNTVESHQKIDINHIYAILERLEASVTVIKQDMENYKNIVQTLTDENTVLRNENDELKNRMTNVESYLENKKQQQINNNIIICGVQQKPEEDIKQIVSTITTHLEIDIQPEDICSAYRKPTSKSATNSSGMPSPIVVTLRSKTIKDAIFAAKRGKNLSTRITEHNTQGSGRPIYINEQPTRHKQQIFKMARDLKREHRVEYAWAKNGDIYVRKTADSSAIKIVNKEQLNDI